MYVNAAVPSSGTRFDSPWPLRSEGARSRCPFPDARGSHQRVADGNCRALRPGRGTAPTTPRIVSKTKDDVSVVHRVERLRTARLRPPLLVLDRELRYDLIPSSVPLGIAVLRQIVTRGIRSGSISRFKKPMSRSEPVRSCSALGCSFATGGTVLPHCDSDNPIVF